MSRAAFGLRLAVLVAASAMAAFAAPVAAAADSDPSPSAPADVVALASGPLATEIQESLAGTVVTDAGADELPGVPDWSGDLRVGAPHQLHAFDPAWIRGESVAAPVVASQEWLAPLLLDGVAVGAVRIWRPDGTAEMAGYDADAELGASLQALDASSVLVEDVPSASWYTLADDVLTPVASSSMAQQITAPVNMGAAQQLMHPSGDSEGGGSAVSLVVLYALIAAMIVAVPVVMIVTVARRRRGRDDVLARVFSHRDAALHAASGPGPGHASSRPLE